MGTVNRKNNRRVSLGLKALLGFGFYDRWGGVTKNNAENRITVFNYFLICVYLSHKNKQRVKSSPSLSHPQMKCYPQREIQQKAVRGKNPHDPGELQGCVIPSPSPPAQGRCEEDAHRGFGLLARAACS